MEKEFNDMQIEFGKRIKDIRKTFDITQTEFGNKIGLAPNTITNYETGRRSPSNQIIISICREFNVNEIWLRTGEGGNDNMFTKVSDDDRYSLNLGKLTLTENRFIQNAINMLAETEPEKLKIIEDIMKKCLGID